MTGTGVPAQEKTYWNGEECHALHVEVIVADDTRFPLYWARELVGQRRKAIAVTWGGHTFYIDDEDGQGWLKVTEGRGMWTYGHRDLAVERVL